MKNYTEIERQLREKIGDKTFEHLQFCAARLWQGLGGKGPEPITKDQYIFNLDNRIIDDWIRMLYLMLRGSSHVDLNLYFKHTRQGIYLSPRLTQSLLQQCPITISKQDEKRLHQWLKDVIKEKIR